MDQAIKKIHTYSELQEEKKKLQAEIHYSKEQMMRSLNETTTHAKSLLLKGVVLPAGIAGLAVAGVKVAQSLRSDHESEEETVQSYDSYDATQPTSILDSIRQNLAANSKWYIRVLPIAFQLIRGYIENRSKNSAYSYQYQDEEDENYYPTESSVSSYPSESAPLVRVGSR